MREEIFKDAEKCRDVIEAYRKEKLEAYNPEEQIDYFLARLWQRIEKSGVSWLSQYKDQEIDSKTSAIEILNFFKNWVEYHRGWVVILNAGSQKREKIVQRVINLSGLSYIKANNLSMSCEADEGRGPVDFKISRGQDITIIEVKLSSNAQYLHGYETQVEEYARAEQTDNMIYVLVDVGNSGRMKKFCDRYNRYIDEGKKVPEAIMIDATSKESASIT